MSVHQPEQTGGNSPPPAPEVYSADEVARAAGVDRGLVRRLIAGGEIATIDGLLVAEGDALRAVRRLRSGPIHLCLPVFGGALLQRDVDDSRSAAVSAAISTPLPADMRFNVTAVLTEKDYLTETEFIRLIPGEEADNASRVFVGVSKYLTDAVNALLQVGWTRAETEIGDAYFERYSGRLLVRYRP